MGVPRFAAFDKGKHALAKVPSAGLPLLLALLLCPRLGTSCPIKLPLDAFSGTGHHYQVYRYLGQSETLEAPPHLRSLSHSLSRTQSRTQSQSAPLQWQKVPWQLLYAQGSKAPSQGKKPLEGKPRKIATHGLTLSRYYGEVAPVTAKGPCRSVRPAFQSREYIAGRSRALYGFACSDGRQPSIHAPRPAPSAAPSATKSPSVSPAVNQSRHAVLSKNYYYSYEGQNKLLFKSLALAKASKGSYQRIAAGANQQIVANFKNFFTMVFDPRDFHVKELSNQQGQAGVYSQLNFLLKALGLKLDLDLVTEVFFHPEGLYTPMILHMPLDAKKYLKKGSGVIYSWTTEPGFRWRQGQPGVPSLARPQSAAEVVAKYCRSRCYFSIQGTITAPGASGVRDIYLHFRLPRYLVAKGFYPVYFADGQKLQQSLALDTTTSPPSSKGKPSSRTPRSGFYFEAVGLARGSHRWDLAIDTRQPALVRDLPCGDASGVFAWRHHDRSLTP